MSEDDINLVNSVTVGLTIIDRGDGRIRIQSSVPGCYVYGPVDEAMADMGKVLQLLLVLSKQPLAEARGFIVREHA